MILSVTSPKLASTKNVKILVHTRNVEQMQFVLLKPTSLSVLALVVTLVIHMCCVDNLNAYKILIVQLLWLAEMKIVLTLVIVLQMLIVMLVITEATVPVALVLQVTPTQLVVIQVRQFQVC